MFELIAVLILSRLISGRQSTNGTGEASVRREISYRAKDGATDYRFSIEQQRDDSYRVYIMSQPSYGSRSTTSADTHRLTDAADRRYICWSHSIENDLQARHVAATWADATQRYIRTGARF